MTLPVSNTSRNDETPTLAVVFPHDAKAFPAAAMADLVSVRPISGTVPSSSSVAGSANQVSELIDVSCTQYEDDILVTRIVPPSAAFTHFPSIYA